MSAPFRVKLLLLPFFCKSHSRFYYSVSDLAEVVLMAGNYGTAGWLKWQGGNGFPHLLCWIDSCSKLADGCLLLWGKWILSKKRALKSIRVTLTHHVTWPQLTAWSHTLIITIIRTHINESYLSHWGSSASPQGKSIIVKLTFQRVIQTFQWEE